MPFLKLRDVPAAQLDQVIDTFTDRNWIHLEEGYLWVAAHELGDWWQPLLGLATDVDVLDLLCKLHTRSTARTSEA